MSIESGGGFYQQGSAVEQTEPTKQVEDKEKLSNQELDVLFFDAPFHFDPALSDPLDDSGMRKEIPRGALSVATMLTLQRHDYDGMAVSSEDLAPFAAGVVPMDAFVEQDFENDQTEIEQIKEENFPPTGQESTDVLQGEVAREAFYIKKIRENVDRLIHERNPKVIAFSYMFSPTERSIITMARHVKENYPDKIIVIGGNAASFDDKSRERLLDPDQVGADIITTSEGEWSMLKLMDALRKNEYNKNKIDLSAIKGISYWQNDKIVENSREMRGDPAEIGSLNYDKVILPKGVNISDFNHYVLYARGCLGTCVFCTSCENYRRFITDIGLESFEEELLYVAGAVNSRKEGEKNIGILDDDLLLELLIDKEGNIVDEKVALKQGLEVERKTVFEIIAPKLKKVHEKYPDINFVTQARVSHLRGNEYRDLGKMTNQRANTYIEQPKNQLEEMKACGVNLMLLGIESGSQEILNKSHKDTKVEWVEPACRQLKAAGIDVGAFWIIGLPGATLKEEEESFKFLKHLVDNELIDELEAHVFVLLPGTPAYKDAHRENPVNNIRLDQSSDQPNQDLFSGRTNYTHVDKEGNVVLSKEDLQRLYVDTKGLVDILKARNQVKGKLKP